MPTLLAVNNYYYRRGGAETVFMEHNRRLGEQGWRIIPFAMRHPQNDDTPWSTYFVDEIEWGRPYSPIQKAVRAAKVVYSWEARVKLDRLLRSVPADLCHVHNLYHHLSPAILGAVKKHRIPIVLTVHDLKLACPAYKMLDGRQRLCERCRHGRIFNAVRHRCIKGSFTASALAALESGVHRLLRTYERHVDRFIVPSKFYLQKLQEWGWSPERFRYVPNFVDVQCWQPTRPVGEVFLYFGRLGPEKGLATLIRACAKVGVPLWLAGEGEEGPKLRELARALGSKVTFLGRLEGQALHRAIASARATVLPSEWYENAPMSVLESYAAGRPVIGAAIGGITELVRDGQTGFIFPPASVDRLAERLEYTAGLSDERVLEMGAQGRRWVETQFTAQRYLERILAVYAELNP